MIKAAALCLLLTACAKPVEVEHPVKAVPAATDRAGYDAAVERALTFEDSTGFVISRNGDEEKHQGDSLLFTGLLVASTTCEKGARAAQAIFDMKPSFWRHPSLPDEDVSLDQALGAYLAIAYRIQKCGEKEKWAPFLAEHKRVGGPDVPPYFQYVRDRLFELAGVADSPKDELAALEAELGLWALGVKLSKSACYRPHLGLLSFEVLELVGDSPGGGDFCANTKSMDLPTVDQWCGRDGLAEFLENYEPNVWAYRHQRCPAWEDPDGNGDQHPGIDFLRAWTTYYHL